MNRQRLFNDNWEFVKTTFGTDLEALSDWTAKFERVDIPHDWLIYDTQNLYETSTGWYRKRFTAEGTTGTRTILRFDGVYMDTTVYVNGKEAGQWKYGYSTFEFEITALLQTGENEVLVRVDIIPPIPAGIPAQVFIGMCGFSQCRKPILPRTAFM